MTLATRSSRRRRGWPWAALAAAVGVLGAWRPAAADTPESRVVTTASIRSVLRLASRFGADAVILDLDDTKWRPETMLGTARWFDRLEARLHPRMGGDRTAAYERTREIWDFVHQHTRMRPVEGVRTQRAMAALRERFPRVIALTANDKYVIQPFLTKLRALGLELKAEPGSEGQRVPLGQGMYYQDGVVFTASSGQKVDGLRAFERRFGPSRRIAFVDDKLANVLRLKRELGVPVLGVHYTGAAQRNRRFEMAIADRQLEVLLETGSIPSDRRVGAELARERARAKVKRRAGPGRRGRTVRT
jgi:hypothetical protein